MSFVTLISSVLFALIATVYSSVSIILKYDLKCRGFGCLAGSALRGSYTQTIPSSLIREQGYLDLERDGKINFGNYEIVHQGRVSIGRYTDAHKVLIQKKARLLAGPFQVIQQPCYYTSLTRV